MFSASGSGVVEFASDPTATAGDGVCIHRSVHHHMLSGCGSHECVSHIIDRVRQQQSVAAVARRRSFIVPASLKSTSTHGVFVAQKSKTMICQLFSGRRLPLAVWYGDNNATHHAYYNG